MKRITLALFLLSIAATYGAAEEGELLAMESVVRAPLVDDSTVGAGGLSLRAAVDRALENSFSLGAENARLESSRERFGGAKAEYRPQVSVSLRATEYQNPMVITPIHGFSPGVTPSVDSTLLQGSVDFSLLLYDGKRRRSSVLQNKAQVGAARHSWSAARQAVIARTIGIYLQVLGNAEVLQAHDSRLEALHAEAARVNDMYSVGRVAQVEVLRIAAAVADANAERVTLAEASESAERDLARQLGLESGRVLAVGLSKVVLRDLRLASREDLLNQALEANPVVREAKARVVAAEASVKAAKSARKPTLAAIANVTDFGSAQGDFTDEWLVGLRLGMPIFSGGRTARKIGGANAGREEAVQRLGQAERVLAESLDHATAAWRASVSRKRSLVVALEGFSAVAASEELRLHTGVGTSSEFLDAEADLLRTRASLAVAENAMILNRAEVARILGELDSTWIDETLLEVERRPE